MKHCYESIPFAETMQVIDLLEGIAPDDDWLYMLSAIRSESCDMEFVCEALMDAVYVFSDEGQPEKLACLPMPVWIWYMRAMRVSHEARVIERNRQQDEQRNAPDAFVEIFGEDAS